MFKIEFKSEYGTGGEWSWLNNHSYDTFEEAAQSLAEEIINDAASTDGSAYTYRIMENKGWTEVPHELKIVRS